MRLIPAQPTTAAGTIALMHVRADIIWMIIQITIAATQLHCIGDQQTPMVTYRIIRQGITYGVMVAAEFIDTQFRTRNKGAQHGKGIEDHP